MRYTVSAATKEHIDICVATRRIDLLALFIRHAEQLSPEVRGYLADAIKLLLSGKLKFPKKRPNFADWFVLAAQVRALEGAGWEELAALPPNVDMPRPRADVR
ncbi:MAG: hypothetical protein WBW51_11410 [Methyloceanibacter sp.]